MLPLIADVPFGELVTLSELQFLCLGKAEDNSTYQDNDWGK